MQNRSGTSHHKRAERQVKTAGAFPFHRVAKMQKLLNRLRNKSNGRVF